MDEKKQPKVFNALAAELKRYLNEKASEADREILTFPASQNDRFGHILFSSLSEGGFCTLVVGARPGWDPRSHYYEAARFAARRGCKIERAFLLPSRLARHDERLREHVKLDEAAGIRTRVLYVGDLVATLAVPLAESLEFGLWDDAIGCVGVMDGRGGGIAEWRVTCRPEDLQALTDVADRLKADGYVVSLERQTDENAPELEEPMITTAPIALELAGVLCQGDHVSAEDCSWYHGIWQYLRIFNMVSTPTWHADFYLSNLAPAQGDSNPARVLISGAADYSMLAHVLWAFKRAQSECLVTVVDLCETPLFLCKWYAKFFGASVETLPVDVMEFQPEQAFDLIVTDAFLTRFSVEERKAVVRAWRRLLREGGRAVTTVRIERGLSEDVARATPAQADTFRRRALQEAVAWQGFLSHSPELVANQAQRYAERMVSYSLRSDDEVRSLFTDAGFALENYQVAEVPGEMESTIYAEIVARRQ